MTNKHQNAETHILIVDDDQLVRDFAVHTIEYSINRKVATLGSGFQAWEYIQNHSDSVDIIIADANIPDMDGLELLDRVKKAHPQKKFIITTSNMAYENNASELGADALLRKPYDVSDLFTIVQKFIIGDGPASDPKVMEFPNT